MEPLLSLVTGTMDRRDSFNRLMKSIIERTHCSWELVVSDCSMQPYLDPCPESVRIIPERPRIGCVKGYNKAFSQCKGKWVIWLNDDAEVMPGYSQNAIQFMEDNPRVGLGCLYYAENTLPYRVNEYHYMPYANFGIISRELGDHLGWFDEDLVMYGNDNSLTFKVLLAGYGLGGIAKARIWHHSVNDPQRLDNQKNRIQDANTLMNKYRHLIPLMQQVCLNHSVFESPLVLSD